MVMEIICYASLLLFVQIISDIDQVYFDETSVDCSKFELEVSHCLDRANVCEREERIISGMHIMSPTMLFYNLLSLSVHVHYGTM